jgi:hypothetical protein
MPPWKFRDPVKEARFREYFLASLIDRYDSLLRWNLVGGYALNFSLTLWLVFFDDGDFGQYFGMAFRWWGNITGTFMYCIKWSDGHKPIIAKVYVFLTRIFFLLFAAIEAGLKQPDSKLKVCPLWGMYVLGIFFPTYEEFLIYSIVISYVELCRLIVFGGPCPVDSSRSCTTFELLERFAHHTLYLCIAAWIQYHANSDRRKDFVRMSRKDTSDRARRPAADGILQVSNGTTRPQDDVDTAQTSGSAPGSRQPRKRFSESLDEPYFEERTSMRNEFTALGLLCLLVLAVSVAASVRARAARGKRVGSHRAGGAGKSGDMQRRAGVEKGTPGDRNRCEPERKIVRLRRRQRYSHLDVL